MKKEYYYTFAEYNLIENKIKTTLGNLASDFDYLMIEGYGEAKGFTINNGKKLYWYITPYSSTGKYRCLPIEPDGLGYARFCYPEVSVIIHY